MWKNDQATFSQFPAAPNTVEPRPRGGAAASGRTEADLDLSPDPRPRAGRRAGEGRAHALHPAPRRARAGVAGHGRPGLRPASQRGLPGQHTGLGHLRRGQGPRCVFRRGCACGRRPPAARRAASAQARGARGHTAPRQCGRRTVRGAGARRRPVPAGPLAQGVAGQRPARDDRTAGRQRSPWPGPLEGTDRTLPRRCARHLL